MRKRGRLSGFLIRLVQGAITGAAAGTAAWLLSSVTSVTIIDEWLLDSTLVGRGQRDTSAKIVLIALDEQSLQELGKPTPYLSPELAQVLEFLHEHRARAVGVDMMVPAFLSDLPGIRTVDSQTPRIDGDPLAVAKVVREHRNTVFIVRELGGQLTLPLNEWYTPLMPQPGFDDDDDPDPLARDSELPIHLAAVEMSEDQDFVARAQTLLYEFQTERSAKPPWPHLALALASIASQSPIQFDDQGNMLLGGETVETNEAYQVRVNYCGPPGTFPCIPFNDILQKRTSAEQEKQIDDAIAIVGATAEGMDDFFITPYAHRLSMWKTPTTRLARMSGIEFHANVVSTLLDRASLRRLPRHWQLALLALAGSGFGCFLAWLGFWRGTAVVLLALVAWRLLSIQALSLWHLQVPQAGMLILAGLSTIAPLYLRLRWTRRLLGAVKSRQIARALETNHELFSLGGEERIVTIMFVDIRDFSSYARDHSPHEVTDLLNSYFSAVVPIVEQHGGVVNQYMGDGIMVMFNAPHLVEQHAARAVKAGIAMVRKTASMGRRWNELGLLDLKIGVGINTGMAVVGIVGSRHRLDYTAIGDSVNAAARIEAENKVIGSEILISESTWKLLPHQQRLPLGCAETPQTVVVKGVGKLNVFEVNARLDS